MRRPLRSRSCLYHLSPLRVSRQDPPILWIGTGAVDRPRRLASLATDPRLDPPLLKRPLPPGACSKTLLLDDLLVAIRTKDVAGTSEAFFAWTEALADDFSPGREIMIAQLDRLSSPVMSEIIRHIDPVLQPEMDVAHGLNITQGHVNFTDAGSLMDEFGVRVHHRRLLQGIETIIKLREGSRFPLRPVDFDVFFRIAGATMEYTMSPILLTAMEKHGLTNSRSTKTWVEFLKARFMTDPMYYNFDRSRMLITARSTITHDDTCNDDTKDFIRKMDRVRLSENAFKRQPWNRRRDEPESDIRRLLRRSRDLDYRSFWKHFVRGIRSNDKDVELLSVSIEGFSRSSDRECIFSEVLKPYYGIEIDPTEQTLTGGHDMPANSPIYPTNRLLYAIVEGFGAMGDISLGMQLVDFISRKYNVSISPKVWSNLLNWTYISASKIPIAMRKASGEDSTHNINAKDVLHVWKIMTSPPYNITPSFEDLDIYVKTLIITRNFTRAIATIRDTAMPYYQSVTTAHQTAIMDEVLMADTNILYTPAATARSVTRHRRLQAQTQKDFIFNRMTTWFDDILRKTSKSKLHRTSHFTQTTIPNLIAEFPNFFQSGIRYRTTTGTVHLAHNAEDRPNFAVKVRTVMPQKLASQEVARYAVDENGNERRLVDEETGEEFENPAFQWPVINSMKVVEHRRLPVRRAVEFGAPPRSDATLFDQRGWWARLERELMK